VREARHVDRGAAIKIEEVRFGIDSPVEGQSRANPSPPRISDRDACTAAFLEEMEGRERAERRSEKLRVVSTRRAGVDLLNGAGATMLATRIRDFISPASTPRSPSGSERPVACCSASSPRTKTLVESAKLHLVPPDPDAEAEPAARQDVETGSPFGDYALTENT
jgi:hypothetical protein